MYQNKVFLIGNLTKDPELRSMPSGGQVCNVSMATNRTWTDKSGEKKEQVEYHSIVIYGKMAEVVATYMMKGSQMQVEGRLQTRSWDGKNGKQYRTEIIAESIQFGNKPGNRNRRDDDLDSIDIDEGQPASSEPSSEELPF